MTEMYIQLALIVAFLTSKISGKFELFPKVPNFIQYGANEICKMESAIYRKSIGNYTIWAHKMLDSSARNTFGILRGNDYQLGNYEECLNIDGPFPTQYCLVGIDINVPPRISTENLVNIHHNQYGMVFAKLEHNKINTIKFGMCFPSSCSASDIQNSLTVTLNKRDTPFKAVGITYNVTSSEEFCSSYKNPKKFGVLETTFSILSFALLIFVLIGTMGDYLGKPEKIPNILGSSFSIRRNWNELFKVQGNWEETQIFNGIRSIAIISIFSTHFLTVVILIPRLNGLSFDEIYGSKIRTIRIGVEKFDLMVDIFFLMSGLLMVHGILKKYKTGYFNPMWLIFLRYIRLTPLNFYVSMYYTTMLPYLGSGPIWSWAQMMYKGCVQNNNWWLNILYINNFLTDSRDACNPANWYVSCDFQLFIVGVLVMFIMKKNLCAGYAILGFLFILSIIATFIITEIYGIGPYAGSDPEIYKLFWNKYYIKPYTRAPSYFLGILGGIVYDKLKSKEVKLSKMNSYVFIGISLLAMGVSYSYLIFAYNGEENYMSEFALYNALHRPIWSIGVVGVCIVISFGSFPAIRLFLSSSFWTPFAKLTYGLYLCHMIIQFATLLTYTTRIRGEFFEMINLWLSLLVISFIISSFLYVIVEAPFMQIFKILTLPKFGEKEQYTTIEGGPVTEKKIKNIVRRGSNIGL